MPPPDPAHAPDGRRAQACRADSPTGCEAHTRAWSGDRLVAEGFPVTQLSERRSNGELVWLDLLSPSGQDMAVLTEEFGLHPLAIEDAMVQHERPKLDRYRDHSFFAAYALGASRDGDLLRIGEVAAFITSDALVTVRKSELVPLKPLLARWDDEKQLIGSGVGFLLHGLLDVLVDGHTDAAAVLDEEADGLEDLLFDEQAPSGHLQRRAFALRKALTLLRRAVLPMHEVLASLTRPEMDLVDDRLAPYVRDVRDHVRRNADHVDSLRETLGTILDVNLTLSSNRLNKTIFRLTAYAALLTVTTAITGYFGQNVPYPGIDHPAGFIASTVLLVGAVGGLLVLFWRKGWL